VNTGFCEAEGKLRRPSAIFGAMGRRREPRTKNVSFHEVMHELRHTMLLPNIRSATAEFAPTGVMRAAINLSNFLLVQGLDRAGQPVGVGPEVAAEIARRIGVPVRYVMYDKPDVLADAATSGVWDICLIGAEPQRARTITFTSPYAEIQATFLVRTGGVFRSALDVDRPGVRIASVTGAAYDLWLERNIRNAEIVRARSLDECLRVFEEQELDALAGLRPRLMSDVRRLPGARILDGGFATVAQAIGTPKSNLIGVKVMQGLIDEIIREKLIERLINKYEVRGLSAVGPIAPGL